MQDYFGSGLDDAVNGGTTLLLGGSLQTNGKRISESRDVCSDLRGSFEHWLRDSEFR